MQWDACNNPGYEWGYLHPGAIFSIQRFAFTGLNLDPVWALNLPFMALFILKTVERSQQTPGLYVDLQNDLGDTLASEPWQWCAWRGPSNQCAPSTQQTMGTLAIFVTDSSVFGCVSTIERNGTQFCSIRLIPNVTHTMAFMRNL